MGSLKAPHQNDSLMLFMNCCSPTPFLLVENIWSRKNMLHSVPLPPCIFIIERPKSTRYCFTYFIWIICCWISFCVSGAAIYGAENSFPPLQRKCNLLCTLQGDFGSVFVHGVFCPLLPPALFWPNFFLSSFNDCYCDLSFSLPFLHFIFPTVLITENRLNSFSRFHYELLFCSFVIKEK